MDAPIAADRNVTREEITREEWLGRCEAAYVPVFRALIALGASREDAADALQDAFEDAAKQREPAVRAEGWLFVVARRKWSRARWRRRIFRPLARSAESTDADRDQLIDLITELGHLTERQRTVIVARYVIGLSQREIGEALGIAPGTVAATVHQATSLLRQRLSGGMK